MSTWTSHVVVLLLLVAACAAPAKPPSATAPEATHHAATPSDGHDTAAPAGTEHHAATPSDGHEAAAPAGTEHHGAAPSGAHHQHGAMPHRFEDAEAWAKVFDDPARDAWQRPGEVIKALGLQPRMTVADVGAGTGYFTVRLARAAPGIQVIATDIEPDMVRYLTDRARREHLANVRAVHAAADDPRLEPGTLDRVLVVDVWHHIADRVRYAKGVAAALRPGGQVAIVDFTKESRHGPPARHRLSPEAIIGDLREAGLDAALSPVRLPDQFIVIGTRR